MENNIKEKIIETDNWYDDYNKPNNQTNEQLPIFEMKLVPGQLSRKEKIAFVTDGKKATTRFGATIVFTVRHDNQDKIWFIKQNQYSLLNSIAAQRKQGSIVGSTAYVERVGTGKTETRWGIQFE